MRHSHGSEEYSSEAFWIPKPVVGSFHLLGRRDGYSIGVVVAFGV